VDISSFLESPEFFADFSIIGHLHNTVVDPVLLLLPPPIYHMMVCIFIFNTFGSWHLSLYAGYFSMGKRIILSHFLSAVCVEGDTDVLSVEGDTDDLIT